MGLDPGLRRLALGTLLAAYPGPIPPDWAVDLLAEGLAGHTLFGTNIHDPAQVAATTAALRAGRPDVIVAVDEEGGDVTRLAHATGSPYPGNAALGAVDDVTLTRQVYAAIGAELAAPGITVDLAPTVDVNTADENPVIGTRSFGADPARVAAHSAAAVAGLQSAGVAACAKHFPGHGATVADSHHELPTVDVPPAVLRERDLPPFAAVVDAGVRAIMTAHIRVPALTGEGPATFSRAVLVDLLRGEYGFTGTVITDALEMKGAALAAGGTGPAAVRALAAGADLLCIGAKVDATLVEHVVEEIVGGIEDGRLDRARVEEAAGRAAELATWRGAGSVPTATPDGLGYAAALRAVRVEGDLTGLTTPLVVQVHATSTIAEGRVPWGLGPHLAGAQEVRAVAGETTPEELRARAGDRPVVLVGRHLHRLPGARELVEGLAAVHPVTVVEMGWPGDWRPAGARAFVTTYGASHANGRAAAQVLGLTG
ncbi:glycoside hydrolase family 3 protein [Micromonospora yasonensis]|uniref:glycoside hydrolase family 3 N-terminal domain-containing protein n=1 Tax=Micromonospora yasonensis TaxID=1128667 RepID=UPI00222FD383|nr:glycoside hydrolase family 3 N-terminal domain-containing protein [Micromonospora yasonensis]MCW3844774.1 glycoside hydrolase family 3 protein [Micromonospora yasonensis]